ncbi:MAG: hypothetical protein IME96_12200 [Proteobacteria bacterium]|nr:hypothetical protein [Pseudomonadota bacterium]
MCFFDTEKDHAVVPADGTGEGGRAAPKVTPTQKNISLSLTITISSRINAHDYSAELK